MYESLGFLKNPFFTDPLEPSQDGFEKFVGRKKDIHSYLTQIAGREGCVHLVTGNPGVGKTTFVNVMQYVTSFSDPKTIFKDIAHAPSNLISNVKKLQINSDAGTLAKASRLDPAQSPDRRTALPRPLH